MLHSVTAWDQKVRSCGLGPFSFEEASEMLVR